MCATGQTVRFDEWSDTEEALLQFRLLYSGYLLGASRSDTRASLKHEIRKSLSPQLKRLWESNFHLRKLSAANASNWYRARAVELNGVFVADNRPSPKTEEEAAALNRALGLEYLARNYERAQQKFIPLVTEEMGLRCKLDILFLRPEDSGTIYAGGDLDNRIKTLFDALRIAKDKQELGGAEPSSEPIYCLLEDDRLISEIRVNADQLLLLPKCESINPNDVFLVVEVSLQAPPGTNWSWFFG